MKKILSFLFVLGMLFHAPSTAYGQVGIISTFNRDSVIYAHAIDKAGNYYYSTLDRIYKYNASGAHTLIAGGGSTYGEGGMATAAMILSAIGMVFDTADNLYIQEGGSFVIRKINRSGIITTYAGTRDSMGISGDGGPATAARTTTNGQIYTDNRGNLFIEEQVHNIIRKINAAGIITTFAGNGGGMLSIAMGSMATSGGIPTSGDITCDQIGNLYISESTNNVIFKVDTNGIIHECGGNGGCDSGGLRGPAIYAGICHPESITTDKYGNLYISLRYAINGIDRAGNLYHLGGNYSALDSNFDGEWATKVSLLQTGGLRLDNEGNLYFKDISSPHIRKISASHLLAPYASDSFGIFINRECTGTEFTINTKSILPNRSVIMNYGDGNRDTALVNAGFFLKGVAKFNHTYRLYDLYHVKAYLLESGNPIDSIFFRYDYKSCQMLSTHQYIDSNSNCLLDRYDTYINIPTITEIKRNGIAIDTVSSTSGLYYKATGHTGDVFSFRTISSSPALRATCPSSGIVYDTIKSVGSSPSPLEIGFECNTMSTHDLEIQSIVPSTRVPFQCGMIFVKNKHCTPQNGTVTLKYDQRYKVRSSGGTVLGVSPTPSAFTDSTITWNIAGLSIQNKVPTRLYYEVWRHPDSSIVFGNQMHSEISITPFSGDLDTSNNHIVRIDEVSAGYDPNHIDVAPMGYIPSSTRLKYSIAFTNTGNDTAYNIYIMDTLSPYVNLSSFRIISTTAKMNVSYLEDAMYKVIRFDFPDINLLDTVHHPDDCTRGLEYEIDVLPNLAPGTQIHNKAGIYFDFNPVVMTNTTENIIGFPVKISNLSDMDEVKLYPNPIEHDVSIENSPIGTHYLITNLIGSVMYEGVFNQSFTTLSLEHLISGIYIMKIDNLPIKRFIKN